MRIPSICLPALLLAAGCSTTGSGAGPADPAVEESFRAREAAAAESQERLSAPERVLIVLDQAMDKYAQLVHNSGPLRVDANTETVGSYLRQQAGEHFEMLVHEAENPAYPRNRAIAVAALGFSGRQDALDPLLNAASADDPEIATNAVFGLAILRDPRTPPDAFAAIIDDRTRSAELRSSAAWGLHELQQVLVDPAPALAVWERILGDALDAYPSGVTVQALRGVGDALRSDALPVGGQTAEELAAERDRIRQSVERFVSHPIPLVRVATAIALGRMGDEDAVDELLTLLGPAEANQNVRLAARKALMALAGGNVDLGFDVREWRRLFDRG